MKKIFVCFILFVLSVLSVFCFSSCDSEFEFARDPSSKYSSMFVIVEKSDWFAVVYHRDTKVMYSVSQGGWGGRGCFTLLVDSNGNPLLYNK